MKITKQVEEEIHIDDGYYYHKDNRGREQWWLVYEDKVQIYFSKVSGHSEHISLMKCIEGLSYVDTELLQAATKITKGQFEKDLQQMKEQI